MEDIDDAAVAIARWEELFRSARHSMFKTEVLPDYTAVDDGPSLQAWLRGDEAEAKRLAWEMMSPWVAERKASTAAITRVRIVDEPFTPYLAWEVACLYTIFEQTGTEDVRLVQRERLSHLVLPSADFWIFDGETVLVWKFAGRQNATAGAVILRADDAEAATYMRLQGDLLEATRIR